MSGVIARKSLDGLPVLRDGSWERGKEISSGAKLQKIFLLVPFPLWGQWLGWLFFPLMRKLSLTFPVEACQCTLITIKVLQLFCWPMSHDPPFITMITHTPPAICAIKGLVARWWPTKLNMLCNYTCNGSCDYLCPRPISIISKLDFDASWKAKNRPGDEVWLHVPWNWSQ